MELNNRIDEYLKELMLVQRKDYKTIMVDELKLMVDKLSIDIEDVYKFEWVLTTLFNEDYNMEYLFRKNKEKLYIAICDLNNHYKDFNIRVVEEFYNIFRNVMKSFTVQYVDGYIYLLFDEYIFDREYKNFCDNENVNIESLYMSSKLRKRKCLYPLKKCNKNAINSHTISVGSVLKGLSYTKDGSKGDKNKFLIVLNEGDLNRLDSSSFENSESVLTNLRTIENTMEYNIGDITTYRGFCRTHDAELFEILDNNNPFRVCENIDENELDYHKYSYLDSFRIIMKRYREICDEIERVHLFYSNSKIEEINKKFLGVIDNLVYVNIEKLVLMYNRIYETVNKYLIIINNSTSNLDTDGKYVLDKYFNENSKEILVIGYSFVIRGDCEFVSYGHYIMDLLCGCKNIKQELNITFTVIPIPKENKTLITFSTLSDDSSSIKYLANIEDTYNLSGNNECSFDYNIYRYDKFSGGVKFTLTEFLTGLIFNSSYELIMTKEFYNKLTSKDKSELIYYYKNKNYTELYTKSSLDLFNI